jgi:hypothetical protein
MHEDLRGTETSKSSRLSSFRISGCSLEYENIIELNEDKTDDSGGRWWSSGSTFEEHFSLALADLDPELIRIKYSRAYYSKKDRFELDIRTDSGGKVKKHEIFEHHYRNFRNHSLDDDKREVRDRILSIIYFEFSDRESADMVAKAFARAITLCKKR